MLKPHIPVDLPKAKTILDDAGPLTEEETRNLIEGQAKRIEKWAIEKLDVLLEYGDQYPSIAEHLCKKVADKYGEDDKLSALLMKRLSIDRTGKPKGRNRTLTRIDYFILLTEYNLLYQGTRQRKYVLETLAERYKVAVKTIENRITKARKQAGQVREEDFPGFYLLP